MLLLIVAAIVGVALWYALAGRAWLKSQSWTSGFFAWIEPIEIALFRKSETILVGRLLSVGAGLVTLYDMAAVWASSLDLTPITTRLFDAIHVPPDMRGVASSGFIAALGLLISWLRKRTSRPIEVVSAPEANMSPTVERAIKAADDAKTVAVAAVAKG